MVLEPLWNAEDLAAYLRCSASTIQRQVTQDPDRLPPRVQGLRLLRWSPQAVRDWISERSQPSNRPRRGRRRNTA